MCEKSIASTTVSIDSSKLSYILGTNSIFKKMTENKKFGWFFVLVFFILATYAWIKDWGTAAIAVAICTIVLAVVTSFFSQALATPRHLWHLLGLLLGKIVSPLVLGTIFFVLITPVSMLTRLFGRDELKIKKRSVESYWIDRSPPSPASDSFKNQY